LVSFFSQGAIKKNQSKSAENFSIKVRLKNKNQSLIDPDPVFDLDRDHAENFKIKP